MGEHYPYIKFFADIIESGVWAGLSSAAKTLYLVLLKFSDQHFKPVWPSTEILLKLTGFKTKKSIIQGKKISFKLVCSKLRQGRDTQAQDITFVLIIRVPRFHPRGIFLEPPEVGSWGLQGYRRGDLRGLEKETQTILI